MLGGGGQRASAHPPRSFDSSASEALSLRMTLGLAKPNVGASFRVRQRVVSMPVVVEETHGEWWRALKDPPTRGSPSLRMTAGSVAGATHADGPVVWGVRGRRQKGGCDALDTTYHSGEGFNFLPAHLLPGPLRDRRTRRRSQERCVPFFALLAQVDDTRIALRPTNAKGGNRCSVALGTAGRYSITPPPRHSSPSYRTANWPGAMPGSDESTRSTTNPP